jgi:hypothetical protein
MGKDITTNLSQPKIRLSVPGPRRTITAAAEKRATYIRLAVKILEESFQQAPIDAKFMALLAPRWEVTAKIAQVEPVATRAAWGLVNVWLLARAAEIISKDADFIEAESWFLGTDDRSPLSLAAQLSRQAAQSALIALSNINCSDENYCDLLPYILEPHGRGSRLSTLRDPKTRNTWEVKRRSGIFYTPADVAEYMVESIIAEHGDQAKNLKCLDPSCGTGVFLIALMHIIEKISNKGPFSRLDYAISCLYGFDVSTLAVETATFILLHHCLSETMTRAKGHPLGGMAYTPFKSYPDRCPNSQAWPLRNARDFYQRRADARRNPYAITVIPLPGEQPSQPGRF